METGGWNELLDYDEETSCLSREACVNNLLRDAAAGCLYCRLRDQGEEDDE